MDIMNVLNYTELYAFKRCFILCDVNFTSVIKTEMQKIKHNKKKSPEELAS